MEEFEYDKEPCPDCGGCVITDGSQAECLECDWNNDFLESDQETESGEPLSTEGSDEES